MSVVTLIAVCVSINYAQTWQEIDGLNQDIMPMKENFIIMAIFFFICHLIFLSSVMKKVKS